MPSMPLHPKFQWLGMAPVTGMAQPNRFFFMIWCCRWTNRAVATAWCCLPPRDMDLYGCVCGYRVKNHVFSIWSFWTNAPKKDETMSRKKSGPDCLWIHPAAFRTSSSFSFRKKKKTSDWRPIASNKLGWKHWRRWANPSLRLTSWLLDRMEKHVEISLVRKY